MSESKTNITYKIIGYYDLFPAKKPNGNKKDKSKYLRKMREVYQRGFDEFDFKKSVTNSKNDSIILMYSDQTLIGYVFIKEESCGITMNLEDPFFYNFVIDSKYQKQGNGTALFNHLKQLHYGKAIYCYIKEDDKFLQKWYSTRDGFQFSDPGWNGSPPEGYVVFKFPNGTKHVEPEPKFAQDLKNTPEFQRIKDETIQMIQQPDPTAGDDLLAELDDIAESGKSQGIFNLVAHHPMEDNL